MVAGEVEFPQNALARRFRHSTWWTGASRRW
jgi:hypothetical protein